MFEGIKKIYLKINNFKFYKRNFCLLLKLFCITLRNINIYVIEFKNICL